MWPSALRDASLQILPSLDWVSNFGSRSLPHRSDSKLPYASSTSSMGWFWVLSSCCIIDVIERNRMLGTNIYIAKTGQVPRPTPAPQNMSHHPFYIVPHADNRNEQGAPHLEPAKQRAPVLPKSRRYFSIYKVPSSFCFPKTPKPQFGTYDSGIAGLCILSVKFQHLLSGQARCLPS